MQTDQVVSELQTVSPSVQSPPVGGVGEGTGGEEEPVGAGGADEVARVVDEGGVGSEVGTGAGSVGGEGGAGVSPSGAPGGVPEHSKPSPLVSSPYSTSSPGYGKSTLEPSVVVQSPGPSTLAMKIEGALPKLGLESWR